MGERTPLAALDAPASGRMAVAEAITNLLAAPIELSRVKLSCQLDGRLRRARRRRRAVRHRQGRGHGAVPGAGHRHPGGQGFAVDAHALERRGRAARSRAGVADRHRLRHAGRRARHADAAAAAEGDTTLVLVDLGQGRRAWAAACWRRCWASSATRCPTWTTRDLLKAWWRRQRAARQGQLLAYHDRSDGGLWAACARWPLPATWA
jgi:phosphoribosylformylglycinamidine synthase